jgi:hypothetical protein
MPRFYGGQDAGHYGNKSASSLPAGRPLVNSAKNSEKPAARRRYSLPDFPLKTGVKTRI